jgi:hypothetical protein
MGYGPVGRVSAICPRVGIAHRRLVILASRPGRITFIAVLPTVEFSTISKLCAACTARQKRALSVGTVDDADSR